MTTVFFIVFILILIATILLSGRHLFKPSRLSLVPVATILVLLFTVLSASVKQINAGEAGVLSLFGNPTGAVLSPGLNIINPLYSVERYLTVRREFNVEGQVQANDANQLTVDVVLASRVNPALLPALQSRIGFNYWATLVEPAGRTAVRDAFSRFPWVQAITNDRGLIEKAIQEAFENIIRGQLVGAGFEPQEAAAAITALPVQLRGVVPDPKVSNAVAEKTAAQQDLERQSILTLIAEQEAKRRENEGLGVKMMFEALPTNFTATEISAVLTAISDKTRADAMLKAVESSQVGTIIMNGDTASAPAISLPAAPPK